MALISEVVTELHVMSGIEERSIALIARHLREAGLLSQKGRGRGAAHATPLDAARLCIALMVNGKLKDAPQAVVDFGQLRCSAIEVFEQHRYAGLDLQSLCGVGAEHCFEEGFAGLIGIWGDERALAEIEARRGSGFWPAMTAETRDELLSASVHLAATKYTYVHEALIEAGKLKPGPEPDEDLAGWLKSVQAGLELSERRTSVSNRYFSGIRTTRAMSVVEIMPLGEVVAGNRPPGYRETDEELTRQHLERVQQGVRD